GGTILGSYTDQCSNTEGLGVTAYAEDDVDLDYGWHQFLFKGRQYSVKTFAGPTRFKLDGHPDVWLGGDSFETATAYTQAPGSSGLGPDLNLVRQFDSGSSSYITGHIDSDIYNDGLNGIVVRAYRSESGTEGPWILESQAVTSDREDHQAGWYRIDLEKQGVYHVTFNETDDGSATSKFHAPLYYGGTNVSNAANLCVFAGGYVPLSERRILRSGGSVAGQVTDARGEAISDVTVEAFEDNSTEVIWKVTTDGLGKYKLPIGGGPTKLRFSKPDFLPEWSGDANDFASASTVLAAVDETSSGNDAVLADGPIRALYSPWVRGSTNIYGSNPVLFADATFSPGASTVTYQWRRTKGGVTRAIAGAHYSYYRMTGNDLGSFVSVVMTVSPPAGYPNVATQTYTASTTTTVKSRAHATISAKSYHRNVTVTARISQIALSRPDGSAYVSWVPLKLRGSRLYVNGTWKTRKVFYKNGQLSYRFKASRTGYWAYEVYIPDSSSKLSYGKSRYLRVK
ncbi:MAG: carboxypeptidase-like regulatory domain-containing protein, partial [Aeromicrobium sp.]